MTPLVRLALAIHSRPGAYLFLVGSGISTPASIPSASDLLGDLISKTAVAAGEREPSDPHRWWKSRYHTEVTYGNVLETLAPTARARSDLLTPYFEPHSTDEDERAKKPTLAHEALARLAADGFVKLVITTNFDRLLENALESWGVSPPLIVKDAAAETISVHRERATVVKLHGDYLDLATRNTRAELSEYPRSVEERLKTLFGEYGVVIVGWSGTSDSALCRILKQSGPGLLPTYWTTRHNLSRQAKSVARSRRATVVRTKSADICLTDLEGMVQALRARGTAGSRRPISRIRQVVVERIEVMYSVKDGGRYLEWRESRTLQAMQDGVSGEPLRFFYPDLDAVELEVVAGGTLGASRTTAMGLRSTWLHFGRKLRRGDKHYLSFIRRVKHDSNPPRWFGFGPDARVATLVLRLQFDKSSKPRHVYRVIGPAQTFPDQVHERERVHVGRVGYVEATFRAIVRGMGYGFQW